MKLSNLVLGLSVAASGLVAISGSSEASTITLNGVGSSVTGINTSQLYEFKFVKSNGLYQSNFVVGTNKITENSPGFDATSPDYPGSCDVCSFVSTISGDFALETVFPTNVASVISSTTNAKFTGNSSFFTIKWDDVNTHVDFNDFVVTAKAVPVPAVVPGIALAAAFFGSKALKRNKKNASESVA